MSQKIPKQAARFVELTAGRGAKANLARHLGIDNLSILNNWKSRGVPAEYAFEASRFLDCNPEDICVNWATTGPQPHPALRPVESKSGLDRSYVKLIIEECESAPDEVLKTVLGILNGTIAAPGKSSIDENPFVRMQYERFGALSEDVESYYAASSDKKKKEIQLEIGGRVISMFDQRQRQGRPPDGIEERRDGSKR